MAERRERQLGDRTAPARAAQNALAGAAPCGAAPSEAEARSHAAQSAEAFVTVARTAMQRLNNTDPERIVLREINAAVAAGIPVSLRESAANNFTSRAGTELPLLAIRRKAAGFEVFLWRDGKWAWREVWPGDEVEIRGRGVVWVF